MGDIDYGPLSEYEVTWRSGHIERLAAHQVSYPNRLSLFDGPPRTQIVQFHAEINGFWRLVLSAPEEEIVTIRNLTATEDT